MNGKRLTNKILANLAKPRPERTEAEVFAGLSEEPVQGLMNGESVTYRRDDGRLGLGTVQSYDRESGKYRIATKNSGVVTRFWAGVGRGR